MSRVRLSASVDESVVDAARAAVASGRAANVSAWVNAALLREAERDRKLLAMQEALDDYEAAHGVITPEEVSEVTRSMRARAVVVRGRPS